MPMSDGRYRAVLSDPIVANSNKATAYAIKLLNNPALDSMTAVEILGASLVIAEQESTPQPAAPASHDGRQWPALHARGLI